MVRVADFGPYQRRFESRTPQYGVHIPPVDKTTVVWHNPYWLQKTAKICNKTKTATTCSKRKTAQYAAKERLQKYAAKEDCRNMQQNKDCTNKQQMAKKKLILNSNSMRLQNKTLFYWVSNWLFVLPQVWHLSSVFRCESISTCASKHWFLFRQIDRIYRSFYDLILFLPLPQVRHLSSILDARASRHPLSNIVIYLDKLIVSIDHFTFWSWLYPFHRYGT